MIDSSDTDDGSDSDSIPPPPPPRMSHSIRVSLSPNVRPSLARRLSIGQMSQDDDHINTNQRETSYSSRRAPIGMTSVFIDALNSASSSVLKHKLFHLSSFLHESANAEEFMSRDGVPALCDVLMKSTKNTLSYGIRALRSMCRYPYGVSFVLNRHDLLCHLLKHLTPSTPPNVARQTVALMTTLCEAHYYNGFNKVDAAANDSDVCDGKQPYSIFPHLLKMTELDLELKTHVMKFINTVLMYSVGTPVASDRRRLFEAYQVGRICAELALDYQPFVEQVETFHRFAHDDESDAVSNMNVMLNQENGVLQQRLRDLTELCSELREQKLSLEDELKQFKRREMLVSLMWDEIVNLRGQLDNAVSLGFKVSPLAPTHRFEDGGRVVAGAGSITNVHSFSGTSSDDNLSTKVQPVIQPFTGGGVPSLVTRAQTQPRLMNMKASSAASTPSPVKSVTSPTSSRPPLAPGISAPPVAPVAIKPRKDAIEPKAAMKGLHWKRILVVEDTKPCIWRDVREIKVEEDELVDLFQQKSRTAMKEVLVDVAPSMKEGVQTRGYRVRQLFETEEKLEAVFKVLLDAQQDEESREVILAEHKSALASLKDGSLLFGDATAYKHYAKYVQGPLHDSFPYKWWLRKVEELEKKSA